MICVVKPAVWFVLTAIWFVAPANTGPVICGRVCETGGLVCASVDLVAVFYDPF